MSKVLRVCLCIFVCTIASTIVALAEEAPSQPTEAPSTEAPPETVDQGVESRGLPQLRPGQQLPAQGLRPLPPGTFNRLPLRGTSVFDTQFNLNADGPNPINSYLATYLTTVVYPEFLDQLTGSALKQNTSYTTSMHTNPVFFYNEFVRLTKHLFTNPVYDWVFGTQGGYDPEAMVISTPKAVFVVFRGTDRVGSLPSGIAGGAYQWAEWIKTDFRFHAINPDLPTLGDSSQTKDGETKVHQGFWESLKISKPFVIRQSPNGGQQIPCPHAPTFGQPSFRECLVAAIKAAGGPSKKVFIIGHSLGAAHAQIFSGYLAAHVTNAGTPDGVKVQGVYAVAAPHPGNPVFRDTLNRIIGKQRLQRYDFVNDPITMLPPYQLGLDQYGRAGTRIYYDDIKTVQVGVPERIPGVGEPVWTNLAAGVLVGGLAVGGAAVLSDFCFHYPQWYLNAAWSAIPRQHRDLLPDPLPVPRNEGPQPRVYDGCVNPLTVARGNRSEAGRLADAAAAAAKAAEEAAAAVGQAVEQVAYNSGQLFANVLANPIADGTYYFRLLQGRKYLDISGGCRGQNGCKVQLWDIGQSTANNRFRIKKELGAYSIRNGSGDNLDFLEVDASDILDNYGEIQMWEANLPFGGHNANQLWHFYAVPNRPGLFVVRNVASGKVLTGKARCANENGCKVFQKDGQNNSPYQVWVIEKAQ